MFQITTACHLYGWKPNIFLTLWRTILKPDILISNCLTLRISHFNAIFDYMLWQEAEDDCQGDSFQEFRLNLYTLSISNPSNKFLFLFNNTKLFVS